MNELGLQNSILRAMPRLALGMLHKLSIHANKGPWEGKGLFEMMGKFEEEVEEFRYAVIHREPYENVLDEAADVANMCMMIADYFARESPHMPPVRVINKYQLGEGYYVKHGDEITRHRYVLIQDNGDDTYIVEDPGPMVDIEVRNDV